MATIAVGDQDVNETDGLVKDPNDLKLELVEPSKAKDRSMPAYKVPTAKEFLTLLIPASMVRTKHTHSSLSVLTKLLIFSGPRVRIQHLERRSV